MARPSEKSVPVNRADASSVGSQVLGGRAPTRSRCGYSIPTLCSAGGTNSVGTLDTDRGRCHEGDRPAAGGGVQKLDAITPGYIIGQTPATSYQRQQSGILMVSGYRSPRLLPLLKRACA